MTFETFLLILLGLDLIATFCFWAENRRLKEIIKILQENEENSHHAIKVLKESIRTNHENTKPFDSFLDNEKVRISCKICRKVNRKPPIDCCKKD